MSLPRRLAARLCPLLPSLFLGFAACALDDGDIDCDDDGKCDTAGGNGSLVRTDNGNVELFKGYHALFDRVVSQCVEQDRALSQGSAFLVGGVSETFELVYVSSREELARELGVDLGLKVKYPTVNADIGLNLLHRFKNTTTSVSMLLKVSQDYSVRNRHQLKLTDTGRARLAQGPAEFVQTCGTHYLNGVRFGAHLYVLITYDAADEQTALDVKTDLGISQGGVGQDLSGDLKARLSQTAARQDVSVTMRVSATGFNLGAQNADSTLIADFVGAGVTAETFGRIDELRANMARSVANDSCGDAGVGKCDGADAPGYFDNTRRQARPKGVEIGFYDSLPDVDSSGNPFKTIRERLLLVERFIRDYGELQERMEAVYWNELEPFLRASSGQKAAFNVAAPAQPRRTPAELLAVAIEWEDRFYPELLPQIGWAMEKVVELQRDCWHAASTDLFHQCSPGDMKASDMPEWKMVLAELQTYGATGRILPLQYKVGKSVSGPKADGACRDLSTSGISYRLPTLAEIHVLAPLVGFGNVSWSGDANSTWFAHPNPSSMCSDPSFPHPFYRHVPGSDPTFRCADTDGLILSGKKLTTICVPSSGPLPLIEQP